LRKSKSGTRAQNPTTYEAQTEPCENALKNRYKKYKVIETIKSNESGVPLHRSHLLRAVKICNEQGSILSVAKVNRMAQKISIYTTLAMTELHMVFAEYPTIDIKLGSLAEKSAVIRSALEAHLEGLRISDRTKAVMPLVGNK
jgi:DNA invertase Pin-like site-specific DNA recombinase